MTLAWRTTALPLCLFIVLAAARAGEDGDGVNPLAAARPADIGPEPIRFAPLFEDASLTASLLYYGRDRDANNNRPDRAADSNEIHVNSFGQRLDFRSGYAWDMIGFDVTGQSNIGRGRGWSEVLYHDGPSNRDESSASLGRAAVKTRFGKEDLRFEARGGFTPIGVGSLGTSGGLHSHAYRGFETRFIFKNLSLGYGWADRFRNEWDNTYRTMTTAWHQNRRGFDPYGRDISYIHSLGLRYEFGHENAGFVDLGVGEGHKYRRNAQAAVSVPIRIENVGVLTLTGYGIWGKYRPALSGLEKPSNEYHVSASAQLKTGGLTLMAGYGKTWEPDFNDEFQFRLTAWGNSDNRNFIQTWAQLDDFVWHGQNVVKIGAKYDIGAHVNIPGLSIGASLNYGWNGINPNRTDRSRGWEFDYQVEYAVPDGPFKGLALGVYAGHLRYNNNSFHGKQNRDDVKVIASYSITFDKFLKNGRK